MAVSTWKFARKELEARRPVFLAFVAANTRHSPGTAGAMLAMSTSGSTAGTIGGGIMEAEVLTFGEKALGSPNFPPTYQHLVHRRKAARAKQSQPSGLICAGQQTNVYATLWPERDLDTLQGIIDGLEEDSGALLEISPEGLNLSKGEESWKHPFGFEEKGEAGDFLFFQRLFNWKRIAIIGGGHCGLALSRTMNHLGYHVAIFDDRADLFTMKENPYAHQKHIVADLARAGELIDHRSWTHVAVMTANLPSDVRGLFGVVNYSFPYVAVMGAPAKLQRIKEELLSLGIGKESIDKIRAPIGVPMTSNTPEEIAISVAAELLQLREELFFTIAQTGKFLGAPGVLPTS